MLPMTQYIAKIDHARNIRLCLFALAVMTITMLFPDAPAYAQSFDLNTAAENVLGVLNGPLARTAAVIAICVVGYLFFFGNVNRSVLVSVLIGIFLVFSAGWIVDTITGAGGAG